jgi:hypothetical protein
MSVNEREKKNIRQHYFPQPWGGGLWNKNWPTVLVEIAALYESDENEGLVFFSNLLLYDFLRNLALKV